MDIQPTTFRYLAQCAVALALIWALSIGWREWLNHNTRQVPGANVSGSQGLPGGKK